MDPIFQGRGICIKGAVLSELAVPLCFKVLFGHGTLMLWSDVYVVFGIHLPAPLQATVIDQPMTPKLPCRRENK